MPSVRDVMTTDLRFCPTDGTLIDAARIMRDDDIGDVLVMDGDELVGIVTDRDIVVRAVADGRDPRETRLREVCSTDLVTVTADDEAGDVIRVMRQRAVRRVPVLDGGRPVGIVSLGDLAVEYDQDSALADISESAPDS